MNEMRCIPVKDMERIVSGKYKGNLGYSNRVSSITLEKHIDYDGRVEVSTFKVDVNAKDTTSDARYEITSDGETHLEIVSKVNLVVPYAIYEGKKGCNKVVLETMGKATAIITHDVIIAKQDKVVGDGVRKVYKKGENEVLINTYIHPGMPVIFHHDNPFLEVVKSTFYSDLVKRYVNIEPIGVSYTMGLDYFINKLREYIDRENNK